MSDRAAFVSAIAANPDDDLPRLVFADWLEENGDPARAEFIRLQIAARRESEQFPPVIDQKKLARIRELFLANYRDWLRPVYEAFGQPLPVFDPHPTEPTTFFGHVARLFQWPRPNSGFLLYPTGLSIHDSRYTPPKSFEWLWVSGGFVESITFPYEYQTGRIDWAKLSAVEPITGLHCRLLPDPANWRQFDGPHLRHIHTLHPQLSGIPGLDNRAVAEAVCGSEYLSGVRELLVNHPALAAALGQSPLRRGLTKLRFRYMTEVSGLLAPAGHGLDALRELDIHVWDTSESGRLPGTGISESFHASLERLSLECNYSSHNNAEWVWNGPAWERLESLRISRSPLGDSWATALAKSDKFPALRVLRITHAQLTDDGAAALARSPLVGQLRALILDGNTIGDDGATLLAGRSIAGLDICLWLARRWLDALSNRKWRCRQAPNAG